MDSIKDKLIPAIHDVQLLAHIFIVIFFFEDILIISKGTSLLHTSITFNSMLIGPFVIFFVFIALGNALWWYYHVTCFAVKNIYSEYNGSQNKRTSLSAFLLFILISIYIYHYLTNEAIQPINQAEYPILYWIFFLIPLTTDFMTFVIGLYRGTKFINDDKK